MDISDREEADPQEPIDGPFLRFSVWLAGMIDKPRHGAFLISVNRRLSRELHEVVMLLPVSRVFMRSLFELLCAHNFAEILDYEGPSGDESRCFEPVAFALGPEDFRGRVFSSLKVLVCTPIARSTPIAAFDHQGSIETLFSAADFSSILGEAAFAVQIAGILASANEVFVTMILRFF